MSYEKQTWITGDIITAEGLNNIEDGIQEALECCEGGGRLIAILNHQNQILDKTWQQIYDAFPNVVIETGVEGEFTYLEAVSAISGDPTENIYTLWTEGRNNSFRTTTPNDYPVLDNE